MAMVSGWPKWQPSTAAGTAFLFLCCDLFLGVRPSTVIGVPTNALDASSYRVLVCGAVIGSSLWYLASFLEAQRDQRAFFARRPPTAHYDSQLGAKIARSIAYVAPLAFVTVSIVAAIFFSSGHLKAVTGRAQERLALEMSPEPVKSDAQPDADHDEIETGTIVPGHINKPLAAPPVAPLLPRRDGDNPEIKKDPIANEVVPSSPTALPPLTVEVPAAAKPARARAQQQKKPKAEPDTIEGWFRWIVAWLDANSKPLPPGSDGR